MDPWKDPSGWRAELGWGAATFGAAALCLLMVPALPLLWAVGRLTHAAVK